MNRSIEEQIGETLAKENGCGAGVCIWRQDNSIDVLFNGTVKEWLSREENQSGLWLIDGGWGGPPGAVHVRWNEETGEWENGGYCGRGFER